MAALMLLVMKTVSSTSAPSKWSQEKLPTDSNTETVEKLLCIEQSSVNIRNSTNEDFEWLFNKLKNAELGFEPPVQWLLSSDPKPINTPLPSVLLLIKDNLTTNEIILQMSVSELKIKEIEELTRGQRDNALWNIVRQNRLTASNFGTIIRSYSKNQFSDSFWKNLIHSPYLGKVKAIQWGIVHEKDGISAYEGLKSENVSQCGIFLHEIGFFGNPNLKIRVYKQYAGR